MLRFLVSNRRERQQFDHSFGAIEFGRGPKRGNVARCVIQDLSVSRDHVRVDESDAGVRVENLSAKNPIRLSDNSIIGPAEIRDLPLPLRLAIGETYIDVEGSGTADPVKPEMLATIAQPFRPRRTDSAQSLLSLGQPTTETITHWFETVISVQRAAVGSEEFYQQTSHALVELVGLDRGLVLLYKDNRWEVAARHVTEGASGREFSTTILRKVLDERRTFFQTGAAASATESLQGIEAVVASPIFDAKDNVVGALYGSRNRFVRGRSPTLGVGQLEAQVVQLLASVVGAGLARQEADASAARIKVQFEQFFSADLARELQRNPRLLEGQERDITVMFSDIRGFSRLAERLGPRDSCRLVADLMDRLTARIRAHDGVVVDYLGDGLLAMWNAPADQPDHATLSCRAALAMLAEVPKVSAEWQHLLQGKNLAIGIGLNTGPAMVGNTGSGQKFKYGPLGHTVNLASRVEGATKQFHLPALITGSTKALLAEHFATRRLCAVKLVGLERPVDLYELHGETCVPEWAQKRDAYESALLAYEAGNWSETGKLIHALVAGQGGQYDIPSLDLARRSIEHLIQPPSQFVPWVELHSK